MAWITVPGSNSIWQYDNAPTLGTLATGAKVHADDQYYRANGTVTTGIRSFTPTGGNLKQTYVKCRMIGDGNDNGPWSELSKNYYDFRITTSVYAILSGGVTFEPKLVFDFKTSAYKTGGFDSTLANSVTHTASTNATMVDSDGFLKWRPHNLMIRSSDLNNSWSNTGMAVGAVTSGSPFGTYQTLSPTSTGATPAQRYQIGKQLTAGSTYVGWSLVKYSAGSGWFILNLYDTGKSNEQAWFDVQNGVVGGSNNLIIDHGMIDHGDGWWLCWASSSAASISGGLSCELVNGDGLQSRSAEDEILIAGTQFYRSDLGGMVDSYTYVPTTSSAAVYGPRVGHHIYNGTAWVNEGILHESEARTNFVTYSLDFGNASWTKSNSAIITEFIAAPDGTLTADRLTETGPYAELRSSSISSNGGAVTASIWLKAVTGDRLANNVTIRNLSDGVNPISINVNLTDGSFTYVSGSGGAVVTESGNGWWRVSLTTDLASGKIFRFSIGSGLGGSDGESILVWGAQIEAGSTPSSFIPTTGSTVTRAAETLTVPAANLPYSSTNMSIQIDGKMTYADSDNLNEVEPYYWLLSGSNYIYARVNTSGTRTGQPSFLQRETTSGNDFVNGSADTYAPDTNIPFNLAGRYGSTFINGAVDGTALTVNTNPTILPDLSSTDLNLGSTFMGTIGQFRMWDEDLTDTGIATASAPSTEPSLQLTFDGLSTSSFKVLDWSE